MVDLTATASDDSLNHGKFASSPPVVRLIGTRLALGQRLHGETSLLEEAGAITQGAVRTVGNVATAPLRIVTQNPLGSEPPATTNLD